jgi:hypothetical protein
MAGAESEHLVNGRRTAGGRNGNRLLAANQAECGNLHRFEYLTHVMEKAIWREGCQQTGDILENTDSGNDEIEAGGKFLQFASAPGVVNIVRAEFCGLPLPCCRWW